MKEIYIRGFKVKYEEDEQNGINYLYTLSYNQDGSYTLISR